MSEINQRRGANRSITVGSRGDRTASSSNQRRNHGNVSSDIEEKVEQNFNDFNSEKDNIENDTELNVDSELTSRVPAVSTYRLPPIERPSAVRSSTSDSFSTSDSSSSGMFALPAKEPKTPFPFRGALEFLPKSFGGENIPVSRFISACLYARASIAAKDRHYFF